MSDVLDPATIDIISHEVYDDGPPHDRYTALRAQLPIFRHRGLEPGYPEWFWAITRHADVVTVSRQFQHYSSGRRGALLDESRPDLDVGARMIIDTDPPEHTRLRFLVNRGFTPKAIRMLEDHYREVAVHLVEAAVAAGEVDFVTAVAAELPLIAISELLGIPEEDRAKVFDWSNRMIGATDTEYSGGREDATNAAAELYLYANALAAHRRSNPGADIITTLVSAEGGDALTEHEFDLFVLLLSVAGNETTRNAISHGVVALLQHPDAFEALKADRSLLAGSAVEEILRWASPVNYFRRTATCDLELHGAEVREGDAVVMFYASANRDEAVFPAPFRFDVRRDPNPHVTFGGGGPHFCLGANLARLEIRILFEELLSRVDRLELTGPVARLRSNFVHGIKHLPVRLVGA